MKVIKYAEVALEDRGDYAIKRLATAELEHEAVNVGVYETSIPPGKKVNCHYHEKLDEILVFLTPAVLRDKKGLMRIEKGDVVVLRSGSEHEISAEKDAVKLIALKIPNLKEDRVNVEL